VTYDFINKAKVVNSYRPAGNFYLSHPIFHYGDYFAVLGIPWEGSSNKYEELMVYDRSNTHWNMEDPSHNYT